MHFSQLNKVYYSTSISCLEDHHNHVFKNKCIELFVSVSAFLYDFPEVEIPRTLSLQKSCTYTAFLYVEAFVKLSNGYIKTRRYLDIVQLLQLAVKIITGQYFPVCMLVGFIVLVWLYLSLFLLIM